MNPIPISNDTINSSINALSFALWPLLGVVFIIYIVVSLALLYHWRRYGMKTKRVILAETVYFIVSAGIFFVAIVSLLLI